MNKGATKKIMPTANSDSNSPFVMFVLILLRTQRIVNQTVCSHQLLRYLKFHPSSSKIELFRIEPICSTVLSKSEK